MRCCGGVLLLVVCLHVHTSRSLYVPWTNESRSENVFRIPFDSMLLDINATDMLRRIEQYKSLAYRSKSLDERCIRGLPLSIAWHLYPPYSTFHQSNGKKFVTVDGMFPNILKDALGSCCNSSSKVTHGRFLKSVRHSEKDIDQDLFDFIFPLYGSEGQNDFRWVTALI